MSSSSARKSRDEKQLSSLSAKTIPRDGTFVISKSSDTEKVESHVGEIKPSDCQEVLSAATSTCICIENSVVLEDKPDVSKVKETSSELPVQAEEANASELQYFAQPVPENEANKHDVEEKVTLLKNEESSLLSVTKEDTVGSESNSRESVKAESCRLTAIKPSCK